MPASFKYRLLIGLGNPEPDYALTYHNAGSFFVDLLAEGRKFKKADGFVYSKVGGVILIKPLFFMNESGLAVKKALQYFKAKPEETLVIHDDSDLIMGEYKVSFGRGDAGHNGIRSIVEVCQTDTFPRLRLGIRKEVPGPRLKAGEFVLKEMNKKDIVALQHIAETLKEDLFDL